LDILKAECEDVRKCMEEETETSGIFDHEKEMAKAAQPGEGGGGRSGGSMRRQNSDGSMRKGGKGKNNEPLRDKQGKIIEVKALEISENRWKPSKPTDEEEKIYKTVKGLLNKLTLEKFDTLYEQIKDVGINTASLLRGFVVLLYDKAVLEPTFIGMYARMCEKLAADLPECSDEHGVLPFADVLVGK
jgi:translation initiation factor 4G